MISPSTTRDFQRSSPRHSQEKPAGQLFCSSHTTLGLARAFNKVVRKVEAEMELEKLVQAFMTASPALWPGRPSTCA